MCTMLHFALVYFFSCALNLSFPYAPQRILRVRIFSGYLHFLRQIRFHFNPPIFLNKHSQASTDFNLYLLLCIYNINHSSSVV